jgi:hypothetical protein
MKINYLFSPGLTIGIFLMGFISCQKAEFGDAPDGVATGYASQFQQTGQFPTLESSNEPHEP